jgi:hypothetical protein
LLACLVFCACFPYINIYGGPPTPVTLTDSVTEVFLTEYLQAAEDIHGTYTIHDVSTPAFDNHFEPHHVEYAYALNPSSTYWIRLNIKNLSDRQMKWVIEVFSLQLQELEVYIPSGDGHFTMQRTGQHHPFNSRKYALSNFVFDLPDIRNQVYSVYIRVKSDNGIGFEGTIKSQPYFTSYATAEYFFLGLYYGFLIILVIYNLLLLITTKERAYLFYVLYMLTCMQLSFEYDGLGFQFLWPNNPMINHYLSGYWPWFLFIIAFIFYARHFIKLKLNYPQFNILLSVITIIAMVMGLTGILPDMVTYYFFMLPLLLIYGLAIDGYRRGARANRYFIVGQSFLLISIFITISCWFGVIESTTFTVYSFNYAVVLEAIIFSFAFIDKYNIIKKEKEKAKQDIIDQLEANKILQTKVNSELEMKVQERTVQLQAEKEKLNIANCKLEMLMTEVNKVNSKLDYDNWHLNKKITEATMARIMAQEVSFEEFMKVFPTEFSCFSFLEKLKWEDGYRCLKCDNDKYTRLPKLLSRRCSKCLYIESVTNSTVFHALKFPVNKAFYIVYHCSFSEGKTTIDELSAMLDLRRNTCWNFKKKVTERLADYTPKSKNHLNKWAFLMLDR